jgi:hypothetical protein
MFDFDIVPFVPQILGDKTAMTMMWLVLAAKQASSIYRRFINRLNPSLRHQVDKFLSVRVP